MLTFLFAFTGAMIGGLFINYILQGPQQNDDELYRNSGHNNES